jgi:hypothetical protein
MRPIPTSPTNVIDLTAEDDRDKPPLPTDAERYAPCSMRTTDAEPRPMRWFAGDRTYLNKMSGFGGAGTTDELDMAREIFNPPLVTQVLLTTYSHVDFNLLRRLVLGDRTGFQPWELVVCADDHTHEPHPGRVRMGTAERPFTLVHPPQLYTFGSLHAKLILLVFAGPRRYPRRLRVVITSANLGTYDSALSNVLWVQDFAERPPGGRGGAGGAARPRTEFELYLRDLLAHLLAGQPAVAALAARWLALLDEFELVVADGVRLISSVPGRHPPSARGCVYGSPRLANCAAETARAADNVQVCVSSTGRLQNDDLEPLLAALAFGTTLGRERFRSLPAAPVVERIRQLAVVGALLVHVRWLTTEQLLAMDEALAARGLARPPATAPCLDPNNYYDATSGLRLLFSPFLPHVHRALAPSHSKTYEGRDADDEVAWVVLGSANASSAAWGRVCSCADARPRARAPGRSLYPP